MPPHRRNNTAVGRRGISWQAMPARPQATAGVWRVAGVWERQTMTGDQAHSKPDGYWDRAGEQGYGQAMYRSSDVESHVRGRVWRTAIDIAGVLGVPADGRVLDLGCGDGAFANQMLAGRYRVVDGIDK